MSLETSPPPFVDFSVKTRRLDSCVAEHPLIRPLILIRPLVFPFQLFGAPCNFQPEKNSHRSARSPHSTRRSYYGVTITL